MNYPENIAEKLEFDKITTLIKDNCLCSLGINLVDKISFSGDYDKIKHQLGCTDEFLQIIRKGENFPVIAFIDVTPALKRLSSKVTYLFENEIFELYKSIDNIDQIKIFFTSKDHEIYPLNKEKAEKVNIEKQIFVEIVKILDTKGNIKDTASNELYKIRQQLHSERISLSKKVQQIIRSAQKEGWISDESKASVRDGRVVIPIDAMYKRKMGGIVVDESATGKTAYIEPQAILELNNKIKELENIERRELTKILIAFSDFIRPYLHDLLNAYHFLAEIDMNRAKAYFAISIDAIVPKFENTQELDWKDARHPLLHIRLKEEKKQIVSLNVSLSKTDRLLLISGPNAGGKSICLKTMGLLQYMLQCGIPIPTEDYSSFGVFDQIFIDIGDQQSIEKDLSTYSSHLINMKYFVKNANTKTLILIDEFGTGTEPNLGGAIAEALLEELNAHKCYGILTTHYANLKYYANNHEGVINGAMLYDTSKLEPLFKLSIGKPGSSFAFEAARKIGLPEFVLKKAEEKIGKDQINFDKNLRQIIRDKSYIEEKRETIKNSEKHLKKLIEDYETKLVAIKEERKKILEATKIKASEILNDSNRLIENTIREIKESQAEKTKTKEVRDNYTKEKSIILNKVDHANPYKTIHKVKKINQKPDEIKVGSKVKLKDQQAVSEVIEIKGNKAKLVQGNITTIIPIDKLTSISKEEYLAKSRNQLEKGISQLHSSILKIKDEFRSNIDIRGMRADEALSKIADFMDNARVCNAEEVKILHGTGTGALRIAVRQYLSTLYFVQSFKDEDIQYGGVGITVVKL